MAAGGAMDPTIPLSPVTAFAEPHQSCTTGSANTRLIMRMQSSSVGNGFRAVGGIDALEEDMTRPVLTANQVLLWRCLRVAGVHLKPHGYGRLFDIDMPDMA